MASTFSSLHFHIVFATKFRKPLLTPPLLAPTHAFLGGCVRKKGAVPIQIGGAADHVHMLVRLKPSDSVAQLLHDVKKPVSDWLRNEMKCEGFYWQDGYSAFTVGRSQIERVTHYIATQAEHHRKKAFEDEYRALLKAHNIEFDERFLL